MVTKQTASTPALRSQFLRGLLQTLARLRPYRSLASALTKTNPPALAITDPPSAQVNGVGHGRLFPAKPAALHRGLDPDRLTARERVPHRGSVAPAPTSIHP
jgi:hypothetical protein